MKFINKIKEVIKERKFKYICFFWFLIGVQFVVGTNMENKGHLMTNATDIILDIFKILYLTILFITIHYVVLELYKRIKPKIKIEPKETSKNEKNNDRSKWIKYFLIIIICWIPVMLAFYPAIISYDGGYQIAKFYFLNNLQHHPILITVFYTTFYVIGLKLNSPTFGMFLFSAFHMIVMAAIFAYATKFVEKETGKKWVRNVSLIFYGLMPFNQLYPITTTKDVIFAGLFLVFIMSLYKILTQKFDWKQFAFVCLIGIIMLLCRNNSVYTLKVSLPILILIMIKNKKNIVKIVSIFLIVIFIYQGVNDFIHKKAEDSNASDTYNDEGDLRIFVFTQAIGRVARDKKDELTDDEKERISYYFYDFDALSSQYMSNIADSTAKHVDGKNYGKNQKGFFDLAIELGKKYPVTYIESFIDTIRGYWYINDVSFSEIKYFYHPGVHEFYHYRIGKGKYGVNEESKLPELKKIYKDLLGKNEYRNIPIIYIIFQPATYFYLTLAFLLYEIYKKEKNKLAIAVVLFTYFASCFLAMCAIIRYIYPVIVSVPLMLGLVIGNKTKDEKEEKMEIKEDI